MAIGKIYDSEELKRIDSFLSLKDESAKKEDKSKEIFYKNIFSGLIVFSGIIGFFLIFNHVTKK